MAFKILACLKFTLELCLLENSTKMHWYDYNNTMPLLNIAKSGIFHPVYNFGKLALWSTFVIQQNREHYSLSLWQCFGELGYYKKSERILKPSGLVFVMCSIREFYKISGWSLLWATIVVHNRDHNSKLIPFNALLLNHMRYFLHFGMWPCKIHYKTAYVDNPLFHHPILKYQYS